MDITKCDICKKIKKEKRSFGEKSEWLSVRVDGRGKYLCFDLCGRCSSRLLRYIKRYLKPRTKRAGPKRQKTTH